MQHLQPNTTLQGGKYRIERVLGQGGFGITYLARNTVFDIDVAIKEFFMKDENDRDGSSVTMPNTTKQELFHGQIEKFKKEAKRMFAIKNEHIVGVQDLFEENGTAYYVMDYVDGENLAERLKRTGKPMTEQEVGAILPQILDALKSVHDAGIWHLDLKPANIMVDKSGNVKLIDFGASKQLDAQKGGATASTAISYTNGYAPREQMEQNYDKFGPWTDIYALGATFYNLLTNEKPPLPTDIDDDSSEDKHIALPFHGGVSQEMKSMILMMLNTDRTKRPQSVDEIIIAEQTGKVTPPQPTPKPTPAPKAPTDEGDGTIVEPKPVVLPKPVDDLLPLSPQPTPPSPKDGGKGWWFLLVIPVLFIIGSILAGIFLSVGSCSSKKVYGVSSSYSGSSSSSAVREVEKMAYETAIGPCSYTGPVDEKNIPHGEGTAFFNDCRYYQGHFEHGELSGSDAYFKYPNGDVFRGSFWKNSFRFGTYTIAEDGSYFVGYFENGKPAGGTWYDKNGKEIE